MILTPVGVCTRVIFRILPLLAPPGITRIMFGCRKRQVDQDFKNVSGENVTFVISGSNGKQNACDVMVIRYKTDVWFCAWQVRFEDMWSAVSFFLFALLLVLVLSTRLALRRTYIHVQCSLYM